MKYCLANRQLSSKKDGTENRIKKFDHLPDNVSFLFPTGVIKTLYHQEQTAAVSRDAGCEVMPKLHCNSVPNHVVT
jgi:hypothetical protein